MGKNQGTPLLAGGGGMAARTARFADWDDVEGAVDLACGTGLAGHWLCEKAISSVGGLDLSGELLVQHSLRTNTSYAGVARSARASISLTSAIPGSLALTCRAWARAPSARSYCFNCIMAVARARCGWI